MIQWKESMMTRSKKNQTKERRTEPRTPCSENIFFATKSQLYEGLLKDYSRNGVFIRTYEDLSVGEMITVAAQRPYELNDKRQGQIVWRSREGYGVELYRAHSDSDPELDRIENRSRNSAM